MNQYLVEKLICLRSGKMKLTKMKRKHYLKERLKSKKLMNYDQPKAIETRETAQINQKRMQDKRSQITERSLDIVEIVFIKDSRSVKNQIVSLTAHSPLGNYWLVDENNKTLEQTYPRSKLKLAHKFINENKSRFSEQENEQEDENEEEQLEEQEHEQEHNQEQIADQRHESDEDPCAAIN